MEDNEVKKTKLTVLKFEYTKLFAYFIIYSIVGFLIETFFAIITKGVLESRQSFLYGSFCAIYGLGAVIMIIFLQYFKKNNYTLFIGGIVVGSITEYFVSLFGELIFNVKWWDYSNMPLNVNGRICLLFSLFWGLLAIYLLTYFNPKIDKFYHWCEEILTPNVFRKIIIIVSISILINYVISSFASRVFLIRTVYFNNIDIGISREKIEKSYHNIYDNEYVSNIIYTLFGDEKMIKTFPNLRLQDRDGKIIYFNSLYPNIKTYYFKIFDRKKIPTLFSERIVSNEI